MFCDELKIKVIAGRGGNGAVSFRREKYIPYGGPDGGDGGQGGDIIVKVNPQLNTLSHLAQKKLYKAESGTDGKKKNMFGKSAEHLIIEVPKGTMIFNPDKSVKIIDLSQDNEQYIIAKGGKGGLGNRKFMSSTYQAPRFAETGEPGEAKEIILELKLVADVGIIGLPSAGKSTLISVISNARPKIAAYPFTTLVPNLGVVDMARLGASPQDSFIIADMPGLIESASKGKGLGIQFLKHISRTKLLVHMVDITLPTIKKDLTIINKELAAFDKTLAKLPQIIVLNKIDMLDEEEIKKKIKELGKKAVFPISALTHQGLNPLLFEISKKLGQIRQKKPAIKTETAIPVLRPHLEKVKFQLGEIIEKKDHRIFCIVGKRIEQLAAMTDIRNPEGLERMYHFIARMGIQKTIERQGAKFGDIIRITEKDIPYRR